MLQARVNFKGVESRSLFLSCCLQDTAFFRNVFLLVVTSTLFEVALGHRRLQGSFWFLARLGFFKVHWSLVTLFTVSMFDLK